MLLQSVYLAKLIGVLGVYQRCSFLPLTYLCAGPFSKILWAGNCDNDCLNCFMVTVINERLAT